MHSFYVCKSFLHEQRNVAVAKIDKHVGFLVYGDIERSRTPEKQTIYITQLFLDVDFLSRSISMFNSRNIV